MTMIRSLSLTDRACHVVHRRSTHSDDDEQSPTESSPFTDRHALYTL